MNTEPLYSYTLDFTKVTEFGASLEAMLAGTTPIPPQGARIDVHFEGEAQGKLAGKVSGVDYLWVRADGRFCLDIHATVETPDGQRIALRADGVATPRAGSPIVDLRENVELQTAASDYGWVNGAQIWAKGTVDLSKGQIQVDAYLA